MNKDPITRSPKGAELVRDTGYKLLKKRSMFNFLKWGEYMKRAQLAERKVELLRQLILLTHPSVSGTEMNVLSARQWNVFIETFPDEIITVEEVLK